MTPEEIVAYLEKNGRSTVAEIGTDNPTMYALEKAGAVQKDGIKRSENAGRGRPPTAWIVANGEVATEVEAPGTKGRGNPEHVKAMQEGRIKARKKREQEDRKAKEKELKELKKLDLFPAYSEAVDKAVKNDTKAAWNKAENLQNQILSSGNRIRNLERELAA